MNDDVDDHEDGRNILEGWWFEGLSRGRGIPTEISDRIHTNINSPSPNAPNPGAKKAIIEAIIKAKKNRF